MPSAFRADGGGGIIVIEALHHNKPLIQICGTINLTKERQGYRPLRFLDLHSLINHFILKMIDYKDGILLACSQIADRFPAQYGCITLNIGKLILWFHEHRRCIFHANWGR